MPLINGFNIDIYSTAHAFAKLTKDKNEESGTVEVWGYADCGGKFNNGFSELTDVVEIYSTAFAFAALKKDGTVAVWGSVGGGGTFNNGFSELKKIVKIYSTYYAFAALKDDGSVKVWGNANFGGRLNDGFDKLKKIVKIYSNTLAFAALYEDKSLVVWGDEKSGGQFNSYAYSENEGHYRKLNHEKLNNVLDVCATSTAFAALRSATRSVVVWGNADYGGKFNNGISELTGVKKVYSTAGAFAALKEHNGSVVIWGNADYGGDWDCADLRRKDLDDVLKLTNVKEIYSTISAFAALKDNGTVVVWGHSHTGGRLKNSWHEPTTKLEDVKEICSTHYAFAALKNNGTMFAWGWPNGGGELPDNLRELKGVDKIYSTIGALKNDKTAVIWEPWPDNNFVNNIDGAFAALIKKDKNEESGTVVVWGYADCGGKFNNDLDGISELTDVVKVYSTSFGAFAALKKDGSVAVWGSVGSGGSIT